MSKEAEIYGIRAVIEAINHGQQIDKVFIQRGLKGSLASSLETLVRKRNISHSYVPVEKLNRLTHKNHQGVIATISAVAFQDFETLVNTVMEKDKPALFLILDQVSDVRNFGAIIRTAECAGVDGIVIQERGAAPVNSDTVKTSAGAVFNVPISKVVHLKDAIYYLQASGVRLIAATEKSDQLIYSEDFSQPTALIMGAEDKGISSSILRLADAAVRIPLQGSIGSLNVAVACGVLLYEIVRQRG